jgi:signal transduction histidine kinase
LVAIAEMAGNALARAAVMDTLEQQVAERTAELSQREAALQAANRSLQDAIERLKELDRLKSQFVSNVSHELRTPLTNIKYYLYLLEHGYPEKRDHYMAVLKSESDLLHRLIEDLLDLSSLDLGKAQLNLTAVDINEVANLLVDSRTALVASRGLTLQTDLAPELPPVLADRKMLMQVFTNLTANATNYTPRGGTITVRTQQRAGGVALSVSDTGPGISAAEQGRLFERFFRGEAARQTGAAGTGLGLAICQEIVQRHGGRITVESEVGKGSTFTVWLPAAQRELP